MKAEFWTWLAVLVIISAGIDLILYVLLKALEYGILSAYVQ